MATIDRISENGAKIAERITTTTTTITVVVIFYGEGEAGVDHTEPLTATDISPITVTSTKRSIKIGHERRAPKTGMFSVFS